MKLKIFSVLFGLILVLSMHGLSYAAKGADKPFNFALKGGINAMGEGEVEYEGESDTQDADTGFSIAGEFLFNVESMKLGGGAAYLLPRGIEDATGNFTFIPIYGVFNYIFKAQEINPFITAHLGYNLFSIDSDMEEGLQEEVGAAIAIDTEGGFYWAIGGGLIFSNNLFAELLYESHSGAMTNDEYDITVDITYTHITISLGYMF